MANTTNLRIPEEHREIAERLAARLTLMLPFGTVTRHAVLCEAVGYGLTVLERKVEAQERDLPGLRLRKPGPMQL